VARTLARRAVYLCVSIDCECDKGAAWRTRRPLSFVAVHEGIGARLAPLFRRYHARATYLLSPELLRDARSVERLRALAPEAELGTHLHGEFAAPDEHEPEVTRVFQRDYPEALERAKLTSLTEQFERAFDFPPRSFRAGRFGIGPSTLGILEALGYAVDSSVTPFVDWSGQGAVGLSFRGAPTQPYHPDRALPGQPGTSPLVEVPVTIRPSRVPLLGRWLQRWLRPTRGSARRLVALAEEEIAAAPGAGPVVLNAMFHNVEVIPGASPYAADEPRAAGILMRLESLLRFAAAAEIPVVGLGDIPALLAGHGVEPARRLRAGGQR
jgi:hypothetical protein